MMNWVELAGSEQSQDQSPGLASQASKFISKSFRSLSSFLIKLALEKKILYDEAESPFINCLRPTLQADSQVVLINCVTPNKAIFKHTLPSVMFCEKIRDAILKRQTGREQGETNLQQNTRPERRVMDAD